MEARVRIRHGAREFEFEGTAEFVGTMIEKVPEFLSFFSTSDGVEDAPFGEEAFSEEGGTTRAEKQQNGKGLPDNFGEYLNQFKKDIDQNEQMLIAGYFAQSKSDDNTFSTSVANELLKEQGIKVSNPSQSNTNNKDAKRLFAVNKGCFRVSKIGIDHVETLKA